MSNPADWKMNPSINTQGASDELAWREGRSTVTPKPLDWENQRPGETQEEYHQRTGKGFFIHGSPLDAFRKLQEEAKRRKLQEHIDSIPKVGQGPSVTTEAISADFPEPLIDWLRKDEVHNPATPADPLATIAPAGEQVEMLEQQDEKEEPGQSTDPSVYYNGTGALEKLVEMFGLENTIIWCRMTAVKYSLRMGKKLGNSVAQEADKITWYLAAAERLQKEHDQRASL